MSTETPKKWRFKLDLLITVMNLAVFIGVSIVSSIISYLLHRFLNLSVEVPEAIYTIALSIIMGSVITTFLYRKILSPIRRLSNAMSEVAAGDFSLRMSVDSNIEEVQLLYDNFDLMVKELAATETLQTDFVSNVSHEFKTPLNAIEGYAMILQGGV